MKCLYYNTGVKCQNNALEGLDICRACRRRLGLEPPREKRIVRRKLPDWDDEWKHRRKHKSPRTLLPAPKRVVYSPEDPLSLLSARDLAVWEMRQDGLTYREIGTKFGVSPERVRQVLVRTQERLDEPHYENVSPEAQSRLLEIAKALKQQLDN